MPQRQSIVAREYRLFLAAGLAAMFSISGMTHAQTPAPPAAAEPKSAKLKPDEVAAGSVALLLKMQESLDNAEAKGEWPYEGVYRVSRQIPIGYRIGGTAISATCLLRCPGYDKDEARQAAVKRAVDFLCAQTEHPLMSADKYDGGYDVRGWGYTYALAFLLELKARNAIPTEPKELSACIERTILWCIDSAQKTEIPEAGGWNYARTPGKETVCPSSPFMTGPTLQAMFEARKQGYAVDEAVIKRAIESMERERSITGSFTYAGDSDKQKNPEPVPGAVGRMLVGECTLYLAGRSDLLRVRAALDSFLAHWDRLEERRAKTGTHLPPFNIAPYYFYYAHYYAAQAIELLPKGDRPEYRKKLTELLARTRAEDGSWNDRVFPRSANFGTAMSTMALLMPVTPEPARYAPK